MGRVKDLLPEQTDPVDDLERVEPEPARRPVKKRFTLTIDIHPDDHRFAVNPAGHLANVIAGISEDVRDATGLPSGLNAYEDTYGGHLARWEITEVDDYVHSRA